MQDIFWFPLNGGNFLQQTASLDCEAVGCYVLLNVYLISNDFIPDGKKELKIICRNAPMASINLALRCFPRNHKQKFYSSLIQNIKETAAEVGVKRSAAGRKGAEARWGRIPKKSDQPDLDFGQGYKTPHSSWKSADWKNNPHYKKKAHGN